MEFLLVVSRWLHLMSAAALIGGVIFWRLACVQRGRVAGGAASSEDHVGGGGEAVANAGVPSAAGATTTGGAFEPGAWKKVAHAAMGLLLLTGIFNFIVLALPDKVEPMPYHAYFGLKVMAALTIFVVLSLLVGRSDAFTALRARPKRWLTIVIVLGGVVVLLGTLMMRSRTG